MPLSVRIIYLQTAVQSLPQYGVQLNLSDSLPNTPNLSSLHQQEYTRSISLNDKNIQTRKY